MKHMRNHPALRCARVNTRRTGQRLLSLFTLSALFWTQGAVNAQSAQRSVPVQAGPTANAANPVVQLNTADLRHFTSALSALSAQGKVAFVAEGKPFVSTLSDDNLDKLTKSLPVGDAATLREVTDSIAHAYDYDVVRLPAQPHLVLLLKRYNNPNDFPQISYEEAVRSLHNIILATNTLNPRVTDLGRPGSPFERLYDSSTAEQRVKLTNPTAVSDLTPERQRVVWQLACQSYFMPMGSFDNVYARLEGLRDPRTVFCWMDWTEWMASPFPLSVFGWEGPFGPNHGNHRCAISHNLHMAPGGATGLSVSYKAAIASGLIDMKTGRLLKPLPDDQTAPIVEPTIAKTTNLTSTAPANETLKNTLTLQNAVHQLNENAGADTGKIDADIFHATVDDALANKTVTLIGTQATPPFVLLDAFSRIYGLWIVAQKDKSYFLTLRAPCPCKQITDVPQEIRRLFPEPMWRAVEGGASNYENTDEEKAAKKRYEDYKTRLDKGGYEFSEADRKSIKNQEEWRTRQAQARMRVHSAEAINKESIRRIRALVEPLVPKNSGKRLAVVEVGDEAHQALAIFHLTQAAQALDGLMTAPVPPYLLHFDRAFVQIIVGTREGPDGAACHLGTFDEEGVPRGNFSSFFRLTPQ